jgi:phage baseplate assembly protein gpV
VETFEGFANFARTGRNVDAAVEPNVFGTDAEKTIVDKMLTDQAHAEAVAQAELDRRTAQEIIFSGVAEGDSSLHVGTIVTIENVTPQLAGRYVLASVNHIFDTTKGFVSEVSSGLPKTTAKTFGRNSQIETSATLGIVTQIDDPQGFGRVRVKLPNFNDVETDWLGVLAAGAGLGKGLLALPDVDDTVLVLLPSGNPAEGIILGGLYGSMMREDWDWGVEAGAVRRYSLQTPNGQRIRLDDAKQTVRLENSDGSFLEMSPEIVRLHANRDLEIEAPGRAITIKAKTIDFEQIQEAEPEKV